MASAAQLKRSFRSLSRHLEYGGNSPDQRYELRRTRFWIAEYAADWLGYRLCLIGTLDVNGSPFARNFRRGVIFWCSVNADADCREGANLPLKVIRINSFGASFPPIGSPMPFQVGGGVSERQTTITGSKSRRAGADGLFHRKERLPHGEGWVLR